MKIDLQKIDPEQFMVHDRIWYGEILKLVQPQHVGCRWDQTNKIFRSSLWNSEGELVSAGFPKFTNWGENPDNFPVPTSLENTTIVEKIDGSCLIVSKYKGNYILRTRGTVEAFNLENGYELISFGLDAITGKPIKDSILHRIDSQADTWPISVLFEWTSPKQLIVIKYNDEPDWYLTGIVDHNDYSLAPQADLDQWADQHSLKRPVSYTFPTIEALMSNIEGWKGKEGVVIYSNNDQSLHKVKALEYLTKHRFKSSATLENTVDLFFSMGMPSYGEFEKKLIEAFDYECFEMVRGFISNICDAYKEVVKIVEYMKMFVSPLKTLPRKDAAQKILSSYGNCSRSSYCFKILDDKSLNSEDLKKLMWQLLKK